MSSETLVLLYVPCGTKEEAAQIGGQLVSERLIACANTFESHSIYRWEGEIKSDVETILLCKTTDLRAVAAEKRICELHSYNVPCVITITPHQVNNAYTKWAVGEVSQSAALPAPDNRESGGDN